MAVFRTYQVKYDAKYINEGTRFLNYHLFRASIVYHLQGANDICLHAQQLKLQYTANYYNKIKMVVAPPVPTKEENSKHSLLPFKIISRMKNKREWIF